jgi:TRAP-type C4-dicarboxylate transport system permease small subunit
MQKSERFLVHVSNALFVVAGITTLAMMVHVVADVSAKYLFNAPIWGTLETVSGYYMVILVFLPLGHVVRNEGHIIVELFTGRLSARSIAGLETVVGCLSFAFMCLFTWKTGEEALFRTFQGEVWDIADGSMIIWPSRWVLPIGAGIMTCLLLFEIIRNIKRVSKK